MEDFELDEYGSYSYSHVYNFLYLSLRCRSGSRCAYGRLFTPHPSASLGSYSIFNNFPYLSILCRYDYFVQSCRSIYTSSQNNLGSSSSLSTENSLKHYRNL